MYLTTEDVDTLVLMLSKDKEVAFLVPTGPYQWRATLELMPPYPERVAVWHIRSGPLPLVGGEVDHADQQYPTLGRVGRSAIRVMTPQHRTSE